MTVESSATCLPQVPSCGQLTPCMLLQVDNLRTNHRGTFVLSDRNFRWLAKIPSGQAAGGTTSGSALELARDFLHLPCALLRGALAQLGLDCSVTADCSNFPAADFTINVRAQ